jgi:hypothetical protein
MKDGDGQQSFKTWTTQPPIAANTDYGKDEDSAEVRIYMYKPFSYFYGENQLHSYDGVDCIFTCSSLSTILCLLSLEGIF